MSYNNLWKPDAEINIAGDKAVKESDEFIKKCEKETERCIKS